jgi:hypothetical protein
VLSVLGGAQPHLKLRSSSEPQSYLVPWLEPTPEEPMVRLVREAGSLEATSGVVIPGLEHDHLVAVDQVDQPMLLVEPPRPAPR